MQPDPTDKYLKTKRAIAEHVGTKFNKKMWSLVMKKEEATFEDPEEPDENATRGKIQKYKMLLWMKIEEEKQYKEDKARVFWLIIGQCTTTMQNKVEASKDYDKLEGSDNVAGLLELIRGLVYSTEKTQYKYWAIQSALQRLIATKQENKETLSNFMKRFEAQVEATKNVWGSMIPHKLKGQLLKEQLRKDARSS